GRARRGELLLRAIHQRLDGSEVLRAGSAGLLEIGDGLFVFAEVQIGDAAVVVGVIVDEDRAVGAGLVALRAVAFDGRGHLRGHGAPVAGARGGQSGVVIVVPRGV